MKNNIPFFFLLFMIASCSKEPAPKPAGEEPPVAAELHPDTIHYLALGDSYTIGQSVSYGERWPVQLATRLRGAFSDSLYYFAAPDIVARAGWTTGQLLQAQAAADTLRAAYNMVSLLIGVNNQFQNRPIAEYEEEFMELLELAIDFADGDTGRVFVLSIPDYAYTPFGQNRDTDKISREIDEFNAVNQKISEALGVAYFDITPISRQGLAEPQLVATDNLHPSGLMYQRWIKVVWGEVGEWF